MSPIRWTEVVPTFRKRDVAQPAGEVRLMNSYQSEKDGTRCGAMSMPPSNSSGS